MLILKRKKKKQKTKDTKGITLVALVITIIILLILATISIQSLTNTGLFKNAQKAKDETQKAAENQAKLLNEYEDELNKYISGNEKKLQADGSWNTSKKVNSPQLMDGMTGIYWDKDGNEIEVTADNQDNWYDYSAQKWANAVTKDSNGNVTGYWVWIPRYAYKIESGRYTSTAGKISVKFLQGTSNKDENNIVISTTYPETTGETMLAYVVHPSFINGTNNHFMNGEWDKEIPGYWVAKYAAGFQECTQTIASDGTVIEPITNTANIKYSDKNYTKNTYSANAIGQDLKTLPKMSYPVFKPLTYVYNCISTGDAYTLSQEIKNGNNFYGLNSEQTDSHQMKNSEWGAVAYLTQSSYGRNRTEIIMNSKNLNNSSKNIYAVTGYAENVANGIAASSTNNKTGIFDLSGCVWERTASYISNGNACLSSYGQSYANTTENINGYQTFNTKWATVYPYNSSSDTNINNYNIYSEKKSTTFGFGDAILETSTSGANSTSWNEDFSESFPYNNSPFFERGGHYGGNSNTGIFAFSNGRKRMAGQWLSLSPCLSITFKINI